MISEFSRYKIIRQIGSGGMANVYLAKDERIGREVALKMLHPHLLTSPESLRRFSNEANAIARISHENIIRIFDYGEAEGVPFIVMEYICGQSLFDILSRSKTIPNLILLNWFWQLFEGLSAAHQQGIFHRDIKPSNIMIDQNGTVRIMDFGVAYLMHQEQLTVTGSFVGTPGYISPEQALSQPPMGRSDIFSAGTLLYLCATGVNPFERENMHATIMAIAHERLPPPLGHNPVLIDCLCDLIERCLRKNPQERADAEQCCVLIESFVSQLPEFSRKMRTLQFLESPREYCHSEQQELFLWYRQGALLEVSRRKKIAALKMFDSAARFGKFDEKDKTLIRRLELQRTAGTVALRAGSLLVLGAAMVFLIIWWVGHAREQSSRIGTLSGGAPVESVAVVSPKGDTAGDETKSLSQLVLLSEVTPSSFVVRQPDSAKPVVESRSGWLKIRTSPPWTKIFVDGNPVGRYPDVDILRLLPGIHLLLVQKDGCADFTDSIAIVSADTVYRQIRLFPAIR